MTRRPDLRRGLTEALRVVLARIGHPARVLVAAFGLLVVAGTFLLWLPVSASRGGGTSLVDALFTATSAVCVTGLAVVDTQDHWSTFGTAVILLLIQLGGLGIVTLATTVFLVLSERFGLLHLRALSAEVGVSVLGDMRPLVSLIVKVTLLAEAFFAAVLSARFWATYGMDAPEALAHGAFHAVSAWNNAGFALYSDNLNRYVGDPVVSLAVAAAVVLGGLGFPVLRDLQINRVSWRRWSLNTKLTLSVTALLLVVGFVAFAGFEWANDATFGRLPVHEKAIAAAFQAVQPRTAGFNSVDTGQMDDASQLLTIGLMMIGGGSASTAGGMKVTTFALLGFVMWAEIRGDRDVNVFGRHVPTPAHRQALTVALAGVGLVVVGALALMAIDDFGMEASLFESASALGTVGLSTGVTAGFSAAAEVVLVMLMFLGRVGPITLFAALALRQRPNLYRYPAEQPLIG